MRRFLPSCLSEHVHHLHLKYRVDGFDTNAGAALRHRKHVYYPDCEVINKLPQHQTHDFHGNTSAAVAEHLEEGEGRNIHGLGVVDEICVILRRR